jgi:hypothetical protein
LFEDGFTGCVCERGVTWGSYIWVGVRVRVRVGVRVRVRVRVRIRVRVCPQLPYH